MGPNFSLHGKVQRLPKLWQRRRSRLTPPHRRSLEVVSSHKLNEIARWASMRRSSEERYGRALARRSAVSVGTTKVGESRRGRCGYVRSASNEVTG